MQDVVPEVMTTRSYATPDNPAEAQRRDDWIAGYNDCREAVLQALEPRPMHSAPRDGTVILAFLDGTNYGQPVRYGKARNYAQRSRPEAWRMAWDDTTLRDCDLLGWLPIPTYEGSAVR